MFGNKFSQVFIGIIYSSVIHITQSKEPSYLNDFSRFLIIRIFLSTRKVKIPINIDFRSHFEKQEYLKNVSLNKKNVNLLTRILLFYRPCSKMSVRFANQNTNKPKVIFFPNQYVHFTLITQLLKDGLKKY